MKRAVWMMVLCAMVISLLPGRAHAVDLNVAGKSAVLIDIATGTVLYESNSHEPLAPASVTKVMTMLLIMEAVDSGRISWDDMVTASEAASAKGGSQIYLKAGETMTVREMVKSIAVSSANDCACAMAEHIAGSEAAFVEMMNAKAKELGMADTKFVNCTSAYDIALMSRELLKNHPDITQFTTIWMDTVRNGAFGLANTNKLIRFYSGATGLKTGFTSGAGYCLSASAEREGLGLIAVVMGCATSQDRFSACKSMLDYGFANYALVSPELTEEAAVPVKLGAEETIRVKLGEDPTLLIDKAQRASVSTDIVLDESVTAPVSEGQQILSQVPLVAEKAVPRLTWGDLFWKVLRQTAMGRQPSDADNAQAGG